MSKVKPAKGWTLAHICEATGLERDALRRWLEARIKGKRKNGKKGRKLAVELHPGERIRTYREVEVLLKEAAFEADIGELEASNEDREGLWLDDERDQFYLRRWRAWLKEEPLEEDVVSPPSTREQAAPANADGLEEALALLLEVVAAQQHRINDLERRLELREFQHIQESISARASEHLQQTLAQSQALVMGFTDRAIELELGTVTQEGKLYTSYKRDEMQRSHHQREEDGSVSLSLAAGVDVGTNLKLVSKSIHLDGKANHARVSKLVEGIETSSTRAEQGKYEGEFSISYAGIKLKLGQKQTGDA